MVRKTHAPASDLRGLSRLTIDAIVGVVDLVEAMHYSIASLPGFAGKTRTGRTSGITGLAYRSVGGAIGLVGHGLDRLLARLNPLLGAKSSWTGREAVLAVLNGVLGDYLAASKNPLAITMSLRRDGHPLPMDAQALANAIPRAGGKLAILVHGLCMNDLQWNRQGHDHGAALARDLGYTQVYLHYNTGLHISTNGRAFADLLGTLLAAWPVPPSELVIIGHSMGGLIARSACHYGAMAHHQWLGHLDKLVFLGTPHHGAPLERGGNLVDMLLGISRYTAPFARLGKIRSAGITDLRYGNLVDADWKGRDRFARSGDVRQRVPLPDGVACFTIAATTGKKTGDLGDRLIGDGIVPLDSALGRHRDPDLALTFPESRQWIGHDMNHLELLGRREVYAWIRRWLTATG
jgi:pimeloyl-ACP methyl ester carboxylesterase